MKPYEDAIFQHKPAGHMLLDDVVVADYLMCVHCNVHWIPRKGSKKRRGWCMRCSGVICGKQSCIDSCLPMDLRLTLYEAGKIKVL